MELEAAPPHGGALNLDIDKERAELEAELLNTAQASHAPFSGTEQHGIAVPGAAGASGARGQMSLALHRSDCFTEDFDSFGVHQPVMNPCCVQ